MSLVVAFVPIWLLVAAGFAARRWPVRGRRLLGDGLLGALSWSVFHLAMPAALFATLARTPLTGFDLRPLLAFAVSTALLIGRPGTWPGGCSTASRASARSGAWLPGT